MLLIAFRSKQSQQLPMRPVKKEKGCHNETLLASKSAPFKNKPCPRPNSNFDMLLPCNSHHIPHSRRTVVRQQDGRQRSASVPPVPPPRRREGTGAHAQSAATSARASPAASPMRSFAAGVDSQNIEQSLRSLIGSLAAENAGAAAGNQDASGMLNVVQSIIGQVRPEAYYFSDFTSPNAMPLFVPMKLGGQNKAHCTQLHGYWKAAQCMQRKETHDE